MTLITKTTSSNSQFTVQHTTAKDTWWLESLKQLLATPNSVQHMTAKSTLCTTSPTKFCGTCTLLWWHSDVNGYWLSQHLKLLPLSVSWKANKKSCKGPSPLKQTNKQKNTNNNNNKKQPKTPLIHSSNSLCSLPMMAVTALVTMAIRVSPSMSVGSIPGFCSSCFWWHTKTTHVRISSSV